METKSKLRRALLLLSILSYINFGGLINTDKTLNIPGYGTIPDFVIIVVILYLLKRFFERDPVFFKVLRLPISKYLGAYLLLVLVIMISMPLRGEIGLVDASKVAKSFFPIFIYFLATYDICCSKDLMFLLRTVQCIGFWIAMLCIISILSPDDVTTLFPGVDVGVMVAYGYERINLYTPGFLFPLALLTISFSSYFTTHKFSQIFLFIIALAALSFQGFRSYLVSSIVVLSIIFLVNSFTLYRRQLMRGLIFISLIMVIFFISESIFGQGFLITKIGSVIEEVASGTGTFGGRFNGDSIFRWNMFYNHPIFGWGFIHHASPYGQSLGLGSGAESSASLENVYSLYSTDSGYLTILIMFGIFGAFVLLILFSLIIIRISKYIKHESDFIRVCALSAFSFTIIIIATQISHAGLTSSYGLLPMSLLLSLFEGSVDVSGNNTPK